MQRILSIVLVPIFLLQSLLFNISNGFASPILSLPVTNQMLTLSSPEQPVMLQGLRYDPQKPFQFEFVLEQGDKALPLDQLRDQGMGLVRYFMAAMTMAKDDLWVNLSPYEKDRIVPEGLGVTQLGSDMLIEDYILKQLSSSLTFPDSLTGHRFWQKIYSETERHFGRTDVPVSTFNKVWIVPDYADVLIKDNTVIVLDSHLKVMMEQDYLAQKKASCGDACLPVKEIEQGMGQNLASQVMRQVIIPVLEKEVNTGSHFAALRQMFHAVVLAEWYKRNLKNNISVYYANHRKVAGIDDVNESSKDFIYKRYLSAYKKGVYNFIREDVQPTTGEIVPHKYFAGGLNLDVSAAMIHERFTTAEFSLKDKAIWANKKVSYLMDVGAVPADKGKVKTNNKAQLSQKIEKIINQMVEESSQERKLSPKVAAIMAQMDPEIVGEVLNTPNKITEGIEEIQTTDGTVKVVHARVGLNIKRPQENSFADGGTTKGGIRYYVQGSILMKEAAFKKGWDALNKINAPEEAFWKYISVYMRNGAWNLAYLMFEKVQLLGLPLGGAKADVFFGNIEREGGKMIIKDLPTQDVTTVTRAFAKRHGEILAPFVGIGKDSPAPDVGTADLMGIYAEAYIEWKVKNQPQLFNSGLLRLLQDKLADKQAYPEEYPLGTTPLLSIIDEFGTANQFAVPDVAVFSGTKKFGGLIGREEATGIGVITVLTSYFEEMGIPYKNMTVSIQGMGAVGYNAALELIRKGMKITTWNDNKIAVIKKDGWSEEQLVRIKNAIDEETARRKKVDPKALAQTWWQFYLEDLAKPDAERIFALPDVKAIINTEPAKISGIDNPKYKTIDQQIFDTVVGASVDVLIPAFLGNQITAENWKIVKAKYIAEGANHPVEQEALEHLTQNGHIILPGILVNSGGVFGSYLQILQALQARKYTIKEVQDVSREKLSVVTRRVVEIMKNNPQLSFSEACELLAWTNASRERLKVLIDQESGEINNILDYYGDQLTAKALLRRIVQFGLSQYLRHTQENSLAYMRKRIVSILRRNNLLQPKESLTNVLTIKGNDLGDALVLVRTFYNVLNGEKVTEAAKRLGKNKLGVNYGVSEVRKLRKNVLTRFGAFPRVYQYFESRVKELDDAAELTDGYGGIDFDASHMLINQKGEADFSQISIQSSAEWQQINGLRPIFLSLEPVNVSQLVGII